MSLSTNRSDIIHHLPPDHLGRSLRADVRAGLTASPKTLPPKWFYDKLGSELFERITELPEYYPTRAEREVLELYSAEMAAASPAETLIELGSGSSRKTPLLLNALANAGSLRRYIAVDVSDSALLDARNELAPAFPDLELQAVAADFETQLHLLPRAGRRMVAFLGGTIGNFEPEARARFLSDVRGLLGDDGGSLLLGTDLVKSPHVLVPAYADAEGVTADFNRNVLRVLNTELGADFDVMAFEHVAVWMPQDEWIEMRLRASRPMLVRLPGVDMDVHFQEGEELRTEISAKFRLRGVVQEMEAAGFTAVGQWTDRQNRYAMTLAEAI
ncbi:L-histidine N(alpha)-methyltransferase [Arthrobacter sp. MMS18-M83]|uniref:L-histidine N(alpha)-methyltransferase n=1 Tax=Arthrobacter sp. MMS18-M83 TaxID=2996261 RepID=UPI00227A1A6B|nr:L-histidine N(alpha)-methyltransferase [Arthrobacter sp. MMS18-M83]WAH97391.1 L-histidine N(alpha)-methyltransferase [Arthrobacter sp. MMS18-M83]